MDGWMDGRMLSSIDLFTNEARHYCKAHRDQGPTRSSLLFTLATSSLCPWQNNCVTRSHICGSRPCTPLPYIHPSLTHSLHLYMSRFSGLRSKPPAHFLLPGHVPSLPACYLSSLLFSVKVCNSQPKLI